LGGGRDRSRLEFQIGLVLAAAALAALVGAAVGSTSSESRARWHRYASERSAFSLRAPPGWRRSPERLVPRLLMPRELVSLGTFPMAVGQGGNCGREPVAAIRRMRPGDALITIQEYELTAPMREHLTDTFPPLARGIQIHRLYPSSPAAEAGRRVTQATVPFSENGRAFEALVYFARKPPQALRRTAVRIVEGMRFGARR